MTMPRVAVLDYGSGNVHSVVRALGHVGADVELTAERDRLERVINEKLWDEKTGFYYGEYQAGAEVGSLAPLVDYTTEDLEPNEVFDRRDNNA